MNVIIEYSLSDAGRKADILAGGSGAQDRTLAVQPAEPEFAPLLAIAIFDGNGQPVISRRGGWPNHYPVWDHLPTAADFVALDARLAAEKAAKAAQEAQAAADRHAADVAHDAAIVRERRTKTAAFIDLANGRHEYHEPAESLVAEVAATPEAVAWLAELTIEREAAKAASAAASEVEQARRAEAERVKEGKRLALRAARGCRDGDISYNVEDGVMMTCPAYSSDRRAKNWMAIISVAPSKPGGLERDFMAKAKGGGRYILSGLEVGQPLEFGADDYNSRGRKDPTRWYGYVVKIEPGYVILHEEPTGKAAVKAGAKFAASQPVSSASPVADQIEAGIARVNGEGRIVEGRIVANEPSQN
jgi:hypothetical protein